MDLFGNTEPRVPFGLRRVEWKFSPWVCKGIAWSWNQGRTVGIWLVVGMWRFAFLLGMRVVGGVWGGLGGGGGGICCTLGSSWSVRPFFCLLGLLLSSKLAAGKSGEILEF